MMKRSERLDWTITRRNKWIAQHIETGAFLFALTKTELMANINKFDHSANVAGMNNRELSEVLRVATS